MIILVDVLDMESLITCALLSMRFTLMSLNKTRVMHETACKAMDFNKRIT